MAAMKAHRFSLGSCVAVVALAVVALASGRVLAEDRVFSGPQVGEKVTPFKVLDVRGPAAGTEHEIQGADAGTGPAVLVFVHGIERSIVPLITVLDEYGHQKRDVLKTTFIFLSGDRVAMEKRLPLVGQSLRMQCPMALSLDGAEGPGNYGLNKDCLVTIVVAKEKKVTANFALVQPGIADAPAVLKAMADACSDRKPPTAEALREKRTGGEGMRPTTRPARGGGEGPRRPQSRPTG
jgi:hypothetical protein